MNQKKKKKEFTEKSRVRATILNNIGNVYSSFLQDDFRMHLNGKCHQKIIENFSLSKVDSMNFTNIGRAANMFQTLFWALRIEWWTRQIKYLLKIFHCLGRWSEPGALTGSEGVPPRTSRGASAALQPRKQILQALPAFLSHLAQP